MCNSLTMSTGWNSNRHANAVEMVDEILSLGINNLEAGYSLTQKQIDRMCVLLPQGGFKVPSVHNFCPIPQNHKCSWGDDFLLSSLNEDMRGKGVRHSLMTIELAQKLGARIVVLHLGMVDMGRRQYDTIKQLILTGQRNTEAFKTAVKDMKNVRTAMARPYFDTVRRTLDDLVARLPSGITLGIENRYEYYSIPNLKEMEQLLEEYGDMIGYWHDTGHAYVQEVMGFNEKDEYITKLGHRLVGLHIHDSILISDHMSPGYGEIDFDSIIPHLNKSIVKVLEIHSRTGREEVENGIDFMKSLML